jgi:hypothetical protein
MSTYEYFICCYREKIFVLVNNRLYVFYVCLTFTTVMNEVTESFVTAPDTSKLFGLIYLRISMPTDCSALLNQNYLNVFARVLR